MDPLIVVNAVRQTRCSGIHRIQLDDHAFEVEGREGRTMTLEEAVSEALEATES